MSMHHLAGVLVLAGGTAARMGGVSKPDVMVAGKRLLDHALAEISRTALRARIVVVAPPEVSVPPSVIRILEDPPFGGPLAGYAAGFHALTIDEGALVAFMTCDAPTVGAIIPGAARSVRSRIMRRCSTGSAHARRRHSATHPGNLSIRIPARCHARSRAQQVLAASVFRCASCRRSGSVAMRV